MGMLIVAVAGGLRLLEIETLAAVVSILSLTNSALSLWGQSQHVHWRLFVLARSRTTASPCLGTVFSRSTWRQCALAIRALLGCFFDPRCTGDVAQTKTFTACLPSWVAWLTGLCGGTLGGMFSASGPVLGLFGFSQPLPLNVIRATLLASFLLVTSSRTVMVGWRGELTEAVLGVALLALPVVLVGTWLGHVLAPPVSDAALKRAAFWLILVMGIWVGVTAAMSGTLAL